MINPNLVVYVLVVVVVLVSVMLAVKTNKPVEQYSIPKYSHRAIQITQRTNGVYVVFYRNSGTNTRKDKKYIYFVANMSDSSKGRLEEFLRDYKPTVSIEPDYFITTYGFLGRIK
jgi:hypothetical protein